MIVEVVIGSSGRRVWHEVLVKRLLELPDAEVSLRVKEEPQDRDGRDLQRLLRLERFLHRLKPGSLIELVRTPGAGKTGQQSLSAPDIILDLTARPEEGSWSVRYDEKPGEQAASSALRSGRQPVVTVVDPHGVVRAKGRPGSDTPGLFTPVLSDLGAGVVTLVVKALLGHPVVEPWAPETARGSERSCLAIGARRIVSAGIHRAYRFLYRAPHWRVGWRDTALDTGLMSGDSLDDTAWLELPDDGYHFYADPFPFEYEGRVYLFVEDFDHRVGKAVISVSELAPGRPVQPPVPVLEHDAHLSYPFVFRHDGEVWMIPESSGAKTVELYRATDFPWTWERHSVLISGVEVSDATLFEYEDRWWMTGTVGYGGSLSDSLCLWSASDPRGPWTPHPHNPVLVDIASARPAGRVEMRDGRLVRPFQDGRTGYGAALGLAEITRLDEQGFEQKVLRHFVAGKGWGGSRIHTLNVGGGVECIDGSRLVPKYWRRKRKSSSASPPLAPASR